MQLVQVGLGHVGREVAGVPDARGVHADVAHQPELLEDRPRVVYAMTKPSSNVTVIAPRIVTVTRIESDGAANDAVTYVLPAPTPVTSPSDATMATPGSREPQVRPAPPVGFPKAS